MVLRRTCPFLKYWLPLAIPPSIEFVLEPILVVNISEELEHTKLKFGEITGEGHAAFGLPNEV